MIKTRGGSAGSLHQEGVAQCVKGQEKPTDHAKERRPNSGIATAHINQVHISLLHFRLWYLYGLCSSKRTNSPPFDFVPSRWECTRVCVYFLWSWITFLTSFVIFFLCFFVFVFVFLANSLFIYWQLSIVLWHHRTCV